MNNSDMDEIIERYKKELFEYAKNNDKFISEDLNMQEEKESVPVIAPQVTNDESAEIDSLEGTNVSNYSSDRPTPDYQNYREFEENNKGRGSLKIQVYAGSEAFPIANANVIVSKTFPEGKTEIYNLYTDISGIVDNMALPAPNKNLSEQPNDSMPYATYDVVVTHPYYVNTTFENLPIFDTVKSIQMVPMIPRSGGPSDDRTITYDENVAKDL